MKTPDDMRNEISGKFKYHTGRMTMKENKNKGLRRGSSGRFYPLAPWKKFVSWLMVGLTVTWIVPPNVVAAEIAEHQNAKAVEQAKRDARTRVRADIPIARQNAENIRILRKTCREIERKLAAKESIDSEMKDIDQLYAHLTSIRTTALKQMDAQRTKMVEKKVKQEMLDRVDQARQEYLKRIDPYFNKVKAISENKSKPEILKKAISDLEVYLVECEKQNQPKSKESKDTATLPRRSTSATHVPPIYSSIPHNGIVLASADDTIGDWLKDTGDIAVSGETTPADLAATSEIVIDDEIRALAQLLENHPVRIYEYVRNNFVYEPYWGSIKGAKRTLIEKAGNDIDLASLTMALLRAAGINCRYVCGTIELTCKEAGKWIGVDDPAQIVRTFQANGIPFETTTSAGQVSKIRLNHTWITAYVDYFPYHGTRNEVPNTWIEIDPSFKQNTFTTKNDLQTTIGINPDTLLVNVKAQSATDAAGTFAAGVPEAFILSEIFSYQEPIRSYLAANNLTTENVFRQRKVNEEKFGLFPVTDNYKIISRGLSFNTLPDSLSGTVTLTLKNENNNTAFTHTTPLSMLADSRITLSYKPATEDDLAIITENAASSTFPVYMVNLIPELKIDDTIVGTGTAVGMGRKQLLEVTFNVPGFEPVVSSSNITVGSFSVLVPDFQNITADEINRQQSKLAALAKTPSVSRDVMLGESLRGLGLNYWHQLDRFNQVTAGNLGVAITRVPSMIRVAWDLNVADQLGLPFSASVDRIKLNIIRDYNVPIAINQEKLAGEKQFAFTSALTGTALEHNVLAQPFAGEAASAARVIQKANSSKKADGTDMKIFTVTAANINEILPNLDLPSSMVADIRNAVNANIEVTVPEGAVNLNGVDYYAYVKRDIATSASEFFLDSRGGELVNNTLTALDLLTDGSAEAYNKVAEPLADWLEVAVDSTTNAGLAYLPAITALNSWYAKRTELDPVTTVAAIIAVSGPITRVYNQPAILNVTTNDKLISPNGDGVKDSFTLKANVTRNAAWKFEILNPQNQSVIVEENNTPVIDINFDQNIPDGVYTYRITASADGVNADPVSGTFKVDCTPPVANFTIVPPAKPDIYSPSLNLRGTADDPNFDHVVITAQASGADAMEVYRSNDITISSILTAIDSTKFANGPLNILMTVTDKAGNVSTCSVVHNVNNPEPDLLPPTVQLAVKNGETAVTSGATVDADSGFLTYSISANDNVAVTKINLLLDGQVYASGNNVSELNNSVLTMTLRDGAHTLQAEAYDAAGNKAQTAILDFSLTSPVSNFRVTPDTARPGTSTITITANIRQAADWTLSFAGTSAGTQPDCSDQWQWNRSGRNSQSGGLCRWPIQGNFNRER